MTSIRCVGRCVEALRGRSGQEAPDIPGFSVEQVRGFRPILSFLNEKDRDILYLIFVSRKKQKDVQRILGRSQPSLCYDIKRIRRRLHFIFYLHSVFDIFVGFLGKSGMDGSFEPVELDVLTMMFYTTSFTMTAKALRMRKVRVRAVFDRCLRKMEDMEAWEVYEIFVVIRSNLNIIRRTYGPPGGDVGEVRLRDVFLPC
jgi:hypothetical protein